METLKMHLPTRVITLTFGNLDLDIDVDECMKVDYGNLVGDMITFPLFFSQIAQLRAEAESQVVESKAQFEFFQAKQSAYFRKKLFQDTSKKPTKDEVEDAVLLDPAYAVEQKKHINAMRDFGQIDALYWAAKSKDGKLNRMIEKLQISDLQDVIDGTFNGVAIKGVKSSIVQR